MRADTPKIRSGTTTTADSPIVIEQDGKRDRQSQRQKESKHGAPHFAARYHTRGRTDAEPTWRDRTPCSACGEDACKSDR